MIALILFGILVGVIAAKYIPMAGYSSVPTTPIPVVSITPSPSAEVTPMATNSGELSQNATPSASIYVLFKSANKAFNSSIVPTETTSFYVDGINTAQKAWKLDLSSVMKTKVEFAKMVTFMETQQKFKVSSRADGDDGVYINYESALLKCNLFDMTTNKSLICVEK